MQPDIVLAYIVDKASPSRFSSLDRGYLGPEQHPSAVLFLYATSPAASADSRLSCTVTWDTRRSPSVLSPSRRKLQPNNLCKSPPGSPMTGARGHPETPFCAPALSLPLPFLLPLLLAQLDKGKRALSVLLNQPRAPPRARRHRPLAPTALCPMIKLRPPSHPSAILHPPITCPPPSPSAFREPFSTSKRFRLCSHQPVPPANPQLCAAVTRASRRYSSPSPSV